MRVTNWARRHTKRVVQRLVEFGLGVSETEVELRFFDTDTQDSDKSHEFEYVVCRMSPKEAAQLGYRLQVAAAEFLKPPSQRKPNGVSWRCW